MHGRFGQAEKNRDPLIQELSTQFRCIVLDLPGFGRSFLVNDRPFALLEYALLVDQLLARLQNSDEKVVLIGHEVGGVLAQLCALRNPDRVKGLVLINTAMLTHLS